MSQPSLSPLTALRVFLRSSALRSAAGAAAARRVKQTLQGARRRCSFALAFFAAGCTAGGLVLSLVFSVDKAGRSLELWLAPESAPRLFYALPAPTATDSGWRKALTPPDLPAGSSIKDVLEQHGARSFLAKLAHAKADGSALIGLSAEQRSNLLALIEERSAAARAELARNEDASGLRDAIVLTRLLKQGQTPEQAAHALRQTAATPAAQSPLAPPELLALKKALQEARPHDASAIALSDRFSLSWRAFPNSAHSLAYADIQAQRDRMGLLLLWAFILIAAPLSAAALLWGLRSWAKEKIEQTRPLLTREWERQSIEDAAGSAKPASKSARL